MATGFDIDGIIFKLEDIIDVGTGSHISDSWITWTEKGNLKTLVDNL